MKKSYLLLMMLVGMSLSACVKNYENSYLHSQSKNSLKIPQGLAKDAITDKYAIPAGNDMPLLSAPPSIVPPGSILTSPQTHPSLAAKAKSSKFSLVKDTTSTSHS